MLSDLFIDSKSIMKRLCGAGTFGDYGYTPCVLSSFKDLEECGVGNKKTDTYPWSSFEGVKAKNLDHEKPRYSVRGSFLISSGK